MPTPKLDAIDRRILEHLQRDGRLTNLELADRVGLSPSPCLRRVRLLEEAGVIEGYAARLNRRKAGLGLTVFIAINLERHGGGRARTFREAIAAMPEVVACYVTSGEHDVMLQVVVADLEEYREFSMSRLLEMPGVKDIRTSFVVDTFKEDGVLPLHRLR
jgi:Lrp/AsnC family leucine-responsive transcriptional regulator